MHARSRAGAICPASPPLQKQQRWSTLSWGDSSEKGGSRVGPDRGKTMATTSQFCRSSAALHDRELSLRSGRKSWRIIVILLAFSAFSASVSGQQIVEQKLAIPAAGAGKKG